MKIDVKDYEKLVYLSAPAWEKNTQTLSWQERRWDGTCYKAERYCMAADGIVQKKSDDRYEALTDLADGMAKEYAVSPDGQRIAYITAEEMEKEAVPAGWKAPIVAEGGAYRKDADGGWKIDRIWKLFVCDKAYKNPVCLLETRTAIHALNWLADGTGLVYENGSYGAVSLCSEKTVLSEDIYPSLGGSGACCMPDGKTILAAGINDAEAAVGYDLFLLAADGSGILPVKWNGDVPDEVFPQMINASPFSEQNRQICLTDAEGTAAVIGSRQGRTAVYLVTIEETEEGCQGSWKQLTDGTGSYTAVCQGEEGYLYGLRSDWNHPVQLVKICLADGAFQVIYDANAWVQEKTAAAVSNYKCMTLDGAAKLDGWILEPADRGGENVPAVLLVHGGPLSQWADAFTPEVQLLAAAGMAVILANPRGSSGYGKAYASYEKAFDGTAAGDLLYYMDHVLREYPWIDGSRLGVAGGSYGGYMSAWLAGHCKRFKAAAVMRGLLNFEFLYFTSQAAGNPGMFEEPVAFEDFLMKQTLDSPNTYAQEMDIPMLIMHGGKDVNCPLDGAHQLYVAVKDTHPDLPVRLIIFPGVGHNIRTARLDYYQRYETELVNWMKKYL